MIKNTGQHHATGIFSELTYKSGVSLAEFIHELSQFFSAFIGHGVVDGGEHAADAAMALDTAESFLQGFGDEFCFEFFARQAEGLLFSFVVGVSSVVLWRHASMTESVTAATGNPV